MGTDFQIPEEALERFVGRRFKTISTITGATIEGIVHSIVQLHDMTEFSGLLKGDKTFSRLELFVRSTVGNLYDFHLCSFEHSITLTPEEVKAASVNNFII